MSTLIQKLLKNNTKQNPLKLITTTLSKTTQQLNLTNPPLQTNHDFFSPNPNVKDSNFTHIYPSFPFGYCLNPDSSNGFCANSVSQNGFCANSISQNGFGFFDEIDDANDDGVVRADSVKKKRKRKMNKHKYKKLKKSLRRKSRT